MRVVCALLLALCAISQGALAEFNDVEQLVPGQVAAHSSRQLLQTSDGGYGYGYGGYGYGYGGYGPGISETLQSGSRRSLLQSGGYGYGGYGYGGYGYGGYGGPRRRLAEVDFSLQPRDELLVYSEQHKQQQQEKKSEELQNSTDDGLSAAAAAALTQAHSSHQSGLSVPSGQCYCRYDVDYNIWALAEDVCKQALYERCKTESGLPCEWLNKFYAPAAGPAHSLPHEKDIAAFLHEDCSPQPPCACAGLKFDGSDSVPTAVGCCRNLKVACKTPFSGLCCKKVAAFCSDDTPVPILAAWTAHNLHHADCSSYEGVPFQFVPYRNMTAAAAAKKQQQQHQEDLAEEKLLQQAMGMLGSQQTAAAAGKVYGMDPRTLVIIAAGAVCVAVVAVLFGMIRQRDDHSHTFEAEGDDQDDQELDGHTNNANVSGLLPTVGSGGGHMPRGVRQPLLQSHSSAPINRISNPGTGRFSAPGDYMPAAANHGTHEMS